MATRHMRNCEVIFWRSYVIPFIHRLSCCDLLGLKRHEINLQLLCTQVQSRPCNGSQHIELREAGNRICFNIRNIPARSRAQLGPYPLGCNTVLRYRYRCCHLRCHHIEQLEALCWCRLCMLFRVLCKDAPRLPRLVWPQLRARK